MSLTDWAWANVYKANHASYWVARYSGRNDIHEWDCDWSLIPRKGLVELKLVCPNGKVGVLGNSVDASDRLFQFKIGMVGAYNGTMNHIIGILTAPNGDCKTFNWNYLTKTLTQEDTNFITLQEQMTISNLNQDVLGVKV